MDYTVERKLTTASISPHMNTLMSLGLINIEKPEKKVYYYMNNEAVKLFLRNDEKYIIGGLT
jgi:hypothetical protein